jgi:DNA-binding GntR family transcriptional regulator
METVLTLQPLKPSAEGPATLAEAVYSTVLEAILSGRLAPGTVVSEVSLARQLAVSRTPVHDALRQLAKDGLVRQKANHRAEVAAFSREEILDVFEMRILLESEAARRAATRIDRPTLARLRATADGLAADRTAPDWVDRWADFDEDFHAAIARAAGSLRLRQDILRYRLLHRGFNKLGTDVDCLQQALAEHVQILDALERRDPDTAASAMAAHIREWQAFFANRLAH